MSRRGGKRIDKRGPLQRAIDAAANEDARPVEVNPFAARHGDYVRGKGRGFVNRGGTPLARWLSAGLLSEPEQAGIAHCVKLWGALPGSRSGSLVANLQRIGGSIGKFDDWSESEALTSIGEIMAYVPRPYWECFENVLRFDEPAGVAGSKLATMRGDANDRARKVVKWVAALVTERERLSY